MKHPVSLLMTVMLIVSLLLVGTPANEHIMETGPEIAWTHTYGGEAADWGRAVQPTPDGGYILAGGTESYGNGGGDAWLVKTDVNGSTEWAQTFGGRGSDGASAVQPTPEGGYIFMGYSQSYEVGELLLWLGKVDPQGVLLWNRTLGPVNELRHPLQLTTDGGYILTGGARMIKTNAEGEVEWSQTLQKLDYSVFHTVVQVSDGGYLLGGTTANPESFGEAWVVKTTVTGQVEWNRIYGEAGLGAEVWTVHETTKQGYIVAGGIGAYGADSVDFWVMKLDAAGRQEWTQTFDGIKNDVVRAVEQTIDGGYILAGDSGLLGSVNPRATKTVVEDANGWVVKTTAMGVKEWEVVLGGAGNDGISAINQTPNGGYILAGQTTSDDVGLDAWLVKLAPASESGTSTDVSVTEVGRGRWIIMFILIPSLGQRFWRRLQNSGVSRGT